MRHSGSSLTSGRAVNMHARSLTESDPHKCTQHSHLVCSDVQVAASHALVFPFSKFPLFTL